MGDRETGRQEDGETRESGEDKTASLLPDAAGLETSGEMMAWTEEDSGLARSADLPTSTSPLRDAGRRLRRNPVAILCGAYMDDSRAGGDFCASDFALGLCVQDYRHYNFAVNTPPDTRHLLGTDDSCRDVLSPPAVRGPECRCAWP